MPFSLHSPFSSNSPPPPHQIHSEWDGSDSGARPDEAISWGKIHIDACPVKVYAEVTLVLPLIVAESFAKYHFKQEKEKEKKEKEEKKE